MAQPAEAQDVAFQAEGKASTDDPRKQGEPSTQRTESSVWLENRVRSAGGRPRRTSQAVMRSWGCTMKAAGA